jgi:hypothetical protein
LGDNFPPGLHPDAVEVSLIHHRSREIEKLNSR